MARVYDFVLGGTANWAIDRDFARRVLQRFRSFRSVALANRMFVNRVVRYLARRGVRQFVEIGSVVLSKANTHQVADEVAPDSKVVYVDNEPVALAHAEMLLDDEGDPDRHESITADLCRPDELWQKTLATGLIDPQKPVALLLCSVLHLLRPGPDGDDHGARCVQRYRELLPRGSYLGIAHVTHDGIPAEHLSGLHEVRNLCGEFCASDVYSRTRPAIEALLGDFEILAPGMAWAPDWHPEEAGRTAHPVSFRNSNESVVWTGVGRKR